jgi:hypothetical protein
MFLLPASDCRFAGRVEETAMNETKYARDWSGATVGMAHWKWGSRRELALSADAQRSPDRLEGHVVFVETSTPAHFRLGGSDCAAVTADPILKPGAVYAFPRAKGEDHLSARVLAGAADGVLQYWEADSFEEA